MERNPTIMVIETDPTAEISGQGAMVPACEPAVVRISNPDAENGYPQEPGPLTWLNSARITTDPDDDAVHCVVSVGDPRGGFCFTVRRLEDGKLVINTPHPDEALPHAGTRLSPADERDGFCGILYVNGDFSDDDPDED